MSHLYFSEARARKAVGKGVAEHVAEQSKSILALVIEVTLLAFRLLAVDSQNSDDTR
jgi:hypothetical protein